MVAVDGVWEEGAMLWISLVIVTWIVIAKLGCGEGVRRREEVEEAGWCAGELKSADKLEE